MSESSFQGAVFIESMNGDVAGGIDALFNGHNFFTGLYRGAIMGASIAGIGYIVSKTVQYFKLDRNARYDLTEKELMEKGIDISNFQDNYYSSDKELVSDVNSIAAKGNYQSYADKIKTEFKLYKDYDVSHFGYSKDSFGNIYNSYGDRVFATTVRANSAGYLKFLLGDTKSHIYVVPNLGNKSNALKLIAFNHEYIYGYHIYLDLVYGSAFKNLTEASAYDYTIKKMGEFTMIESQKFYQEISRKNFGNMRNVKFRWPSNIR